MFSVHHHVKDIKAQFTTNLNKNLIYAQERWVILIFLNEI